ncbi:type VI secretion system tip protein VgrG [Morganella psychrotolerans]|uniref:type VI secretion system Vgr family protein n=1 Tax=Morganella psychrotolerans TaxID=368603 RepID=UPI001CC297F4|nr:type VI secretion system Vgr family protein [Morganella psychrotolerans]
MNINLSDIKTSLLSGQNRYQLTVRGCDIPLDVEYFTGREAVSDTYRYQVTFTSAANDLTVQQLLRRSATLSFAPPFTMTGAAGVAKRVHGMITDFRRLSGSADEARYQIIIEPFFALLRHQIRSHRFFLNQSVPDVVAHIFREHNFKDWEFEFNLKNEYPKREQINQINESDRQFIERLLSEAGIFYYFSLQDDTQTEVIHFGDRQSNYLADKFLPLNSPSGMSDNSADSVWGLSLRHQVVEHQVQTKDYNHRQAQDLLLSSPADMMRGDSDENHYGEVYHYRARHLTSGDKLKPDAETGNFWARLDHERFLARQTLLRGQSTAADLTPLQVLTIKESGVLSTLPGVFQSPVVITRLRFSGGRDKALNVRFDAVPYSETVCWRPALKPRPVIAGTLMARVTSAKDNDIYAHQNEDGFYWVKFDADLDDKAPGYESMPVRLAKPYAGDTYGMHFPLIQGTEVAIAFHEGDPDRPYIAHALHDSRHPDHVTSDNNTRNVIRTPANNKLRMEDKRGEEHIKLSTEYGGKSQLNLGHLVNQGREKRGEGFELRTDSWGAIRAGKGLFISADTQQRGGGDVLAMKDAVALIDSGIDQIADWEDVTQSHKNRQPDRQSLTEFRDKANELASPAILIHAPEGVGIVTDETLLMQSTGALYQQTRDEMHLAASKEIALNAKKNISLLAQQEGIRMVSGKGPFELESHGDGLDITALKDVIIQSTQGHLQITAKNGITLGCGGGYIKILPDGQIEIHTPSRLSLKGQHVWNTPAGEDFPLPDLPQSVCKECLALAQKNAAGVAIRE